MLVVWVAPVVSNFRVFSATPPPPLGIFACITYTVDGTMSMSNSFFSLLYCQYQVLQWFEKKKSSHLIMVNSSIRDVTFGQMPNNISQKITLLA